MVALFFSGTMGSIGLNAHFRAITPKIGGRPPKKGGLTPKFGGKPPKIDYCMPLRSFGRSNMAAFHSHPGSIEAHLGGSLARRPSRNPPFGSIFPCGCGGKI